MREKLENGNENNRKRKCRQITIRLPRNVEMQLRSIAGKKGYTFKDYIIIALWKYMGRLQNENHH